MDFEYPPSKRQKTELAEKYGHPLGSKHEPIAGYLPLKSGLTPLTAGPFLTVEELARHRELLAYQESRFQGNLDF